MPEVQVVPDRNKAADLGISMADIGETINSAIGGQRVGKFKDKGRRFDIRVRLLAPAAPAAGGHRAAAGAHGRAAAWCASGDIVSIEQRPTLQAITRRDRERAITICARTWRPACRRRMAIDRSVRDRAGETLPDGLPRRALGHRAHLPRVVRLADLRDGARAGRRLHGARLPVQRLHAPLHRAAGAALQRERRACSRSGSPARASTSTACSASSC